MVEQACTQPSSVKLDIRSHATPGYQLFWNKEATLQPISLEELMSYSITVIPDVLGTSDSFPFKTNKATPAHYLLDDETFTRLSHNSETLFIEDGNALLHALTVVPPAFKYIGLKLLDQISNKRHVIFLNRYAP